MRSLLAVSLSALLFAATFEPASALPRGVAPAPEGVVKVENRFLPRLFGNNEDKRQNQADMALRIQQLENQVRSLTGQVEELNHAVRQLQQAMASGAPAAAPAQPGAVTAGPGAPPRPLGSVPGNAAAPAAIPPTGPVDLSALNQGVTDPALGRGTAATPAPAQNDQLAEARQMKDSGRYAMAAQEARAVLDANPTGPVAGEARFLLGETMLAQGDYRQAANIFLENYTSDPNGARAPESLLKLGAALNSLGESEAACSSLDELFGAYPNVDPAVRAAAERERQTANCA